MVVKVIRATAIKTTANRILLNGPASATITRPFRPPRRRATLVFTDFPQPRKPKPSSEVAAGRITVHVRHRIERHASLAPRRIVAEPGSHPGMGEFVRRRQHPEQRNVNESGPVIKFHPAVAFNLNP